MTQQDLISSYIDNELSHEVEQEFLISLAASEALRRSFRSELMLKNILRHDEAGSRPPRELRGAIFNSVGLATVATAGGASSTTGFFGRLLAGAKLNLVAASMIVTLSAGAGYLLHGITEPSQKAASVTVQPTTATAPLKNADAVQPSNVQREAAPVVLTHSKVRSHHLATSAKPETVVPTSQTTDLNGDVTIQPQITKPK